MKSSKVHDQWRAEVFSLGKATRRSQSYQHTFTAIYYRVLYVVRPPPPEPSLHLKVQCYRQHCLEQPVGSLIGRKLPRQVDRNG